LDWSTQNFKLLKASEKNDATSLKNFESALSIVNEDLNQKELEQNPFYKIIGEKYKKQVNIFRKFDVNFIFQGWFNFIRSKIRKKT